MSMVDVDLADAVTILDERLYEVEQAMTSPDVMSGPMTNVFPSGIQLGTNLGVGDPNTGLTQVYAATVPAATGLILTPGDHFNNLFVDVDWDAPVGLGSEQVKSYDVEVAQKIAGLYQVPKVFHAGGVTNYRVERLEPNTTYGFRVYSVDMLNRRSAVLGNPANGPTFYKDQAIGVDTTIPPAVQNIALSAGFKMIIVRWDETGQPEDVAEGVGTYRVQLASDAVFTANVETKIITATIVAFGPFATGTTRFARVQAVDSSGNDGPYTNSTPASVTTPTADGIADIQAGTINSDHIITAGLDAAVIKFGTMSGDRITVNTLNANRIVTSSITAANITLAGGDIRGGSNPGTTQGFILNSQGFSLYNTTGVRTVFLDGTTGSATFTGTITGSIITGGLIRTALSGNRVALGDNGWGFNNIAFYSAIAGEESGGVGQGPGKILVAASTAYDGVNRPLLALHPGRTGGDLGFPYIELWGGGADNTGGVVVESKKEIRLRAGTNLKLEADGDILIDTFVNPGNIKLIGVFGSRITLEPNNIVVDPSAGELILRSPGLASLAGSRAQVFKTYTDMNNALNISGLRCEWYRNADGAGHTNATLLLQRYTDASYQAYISFRGDGTIGVNNVFPNTAYSLDVNGSVLYSGEMYASGGWYRSSGQRGWHNDTYGVGLYANSTSTILTWGNARIVARRGAGSTWDNVGFLSESNGEDSVGFAAHDPGQAACVWKLYGPSGERWEARNGADSGFISILASAFTVSSSREVKRNIKTANGLRDKARQIRPVRYQRKAKTACPLCYGGGILKNVKNLENRLPSYAQLLAKANRTWQVGGTCPNCLGQDMRTESLKKSEDSDFLGVVAEEIALEFPELITWDPKDATKPQTVDVMGLATLALGVSQEQDVDVENLKAQVASLQTLVKAMNHRLDKAKI